MTFFQVQLRRLTKSILCYIGFNLVGCQLGTVEDKGIRYRNASRYDIRRHRKKVM